MITVPRGEKLDRFGNNPQGGLWKGARAHQRRTALLACPGCGKILSLFRHDIAADGTVSPGFVCPHGCGFHDYLTLEGWAA